MWEVIFPSFKSGPAGLGKTVCTTASSRCLERAFWASGGTKAVRSGRDPCSPRRRQRTGQNSEDLKPENQEVIHLENFASGLMFRLTFRTC